MDKMFITGGHPLKGSVKISGSKNAALPLLFAPLLTDKPCTLTQVPNLQDVHSSLQLLQHLGVQTTFDAVTHTARIDASHVTHTEAPYDLVRKMRASVIALGPLIARFGQARVSLPGGCAIGARPINFHLKGFERLGAHIELENGYVIAKAKRLKGNRITFEFPSVGATENLLMAATLAEGETLLQNCAREPEIEDLASALRSMGAHIEGDGTPEIHIQGVSALNGCDYQVMADRIEAGTFLAAAIATQGCVNVEGIEPRHLESVLTQFEAAGATITRAPHSITAQSHARPHPVDISTLPFPGFPTDMQAQFMAMMVLSTGASVITETVFENRFMHVPELLRLGADITIRGNTALIRGQPSLHSAPLMATDLRASACLIIAALCAKGESVLHRIYHLDRGYENLETKLSALGANLVRRK